MWKMNTDYPDLSIFKQFAQDNLKSHLRSLDGKKDLLIDEELMKPLDHITGVTFLRAHGVEKIYKLQPGGIEQGCDQRIFIVRPYPDRMKLIAESINFDKSKSVRRKYHVILTPKKLSTCELILEQEGIFGDVTIDEFQLDMIPLDVDLMSFEMPLCFKQFFLDDDMTWFHTIARAICGMQSMFGVINKGYCIGAKSKMLYELLMTMMSDDRDYHPPNGSEIGSFLLVDRDVDIVSMLCSQLTYEGLVAETFGIKSGIVEFGKEVTGSDQSARLNLNSSDQVFLEIRGMHVTGVFPFLSHKAKQLQCGYEKRNQLESVQDFKQFVSEDLKALKQQHKSLALHIGACEAISSKKNVDNFEECLHVEQCLLEDARGKESINYIETCINRQRPEMHCLRLLCLLSMCKGGIDTKTYRSLKSQYLQSFGYHHSVTLKRLKDMGIFSESSDKRNVFPKIRKKFNLIPKDPDAIGRSSPPKDVAYVFGGAYSPFLIKLIEQVISKGLLAPLEETLRSFHIPTMEHKTATSARQHGSTTKAAAYKTVLVVFVGGCTHTEVNALRFIGKQLGFKFVIMTTAILTAEDYLKTIAIG